MRRGKIIAVSLTVCAVGAGMTVNAYAASTTFEMRKKAVSLLGIITTSNYQANVTRGEFAELLVKASDYKEAANAAGTVSVFVDVSSKSQYSAAIRTAATNSWCPVISAETLSRTRELRCGMPSRQSWES